MSNDDLLEILAGCRRGDPDAQERFVRRYEKLAYQTAYYCLWNPHDAEEVTPEVFVTALRNIDQLPESDPAPWLRTITINRCRLVRRSRVSHIPLPAVSTPELRPESTPATGEELEALSNGLASLSEEDRITFLLRHREGLQYEEIAQALTCPVGTVKSRLHQAMQQLQGKMRVAEAKPSTLPGEVERPIVRLEEEIAAKLRELRENGGLEFREGHLLREPCFRPDASELGKQAVLAFRRNLPKLLEERPSEWVAYHGEKRVGIAKTEVELYSKCARLGIPEDEYIVRPIEPEPPDVVYLD